jgi:TorA maturation chaperone TorD
MVEWRGADLAGLRHGLYRFFAASLLYPDEERLAFLLNASRFLDDEALVAFAFHGPWRRLRRTLEDGADLRELEGTYVRLFAVAAGEAPLPPYESLYVAPPGPGSALVLARVERAYAEMGLAPSPRLASPPDHASVEMEAMAFLCQREREAWDGEATADAVAALERQRTFLDRHLGRWFPLFARRVRRRAGETLYGPLVAAADAFIQHDVDLLHALAKEVRVHG